jgi:hypothetical protein
MFPIDSICCASSVTADKIEQALKARRIVYARCDERFTVDMPLHLALSVAALAADSWKRDGSQMIERSK